MMTKEELEQLHDNLEFKVKLKLRELGNDYDGYYNDLLTLKMYKEELEE